MSKTFSELVEEAKTTYSATLPKVGEEDKPVDRIKEFNRNVDILKGLMGGKISERGPGKLSMNEVLTSPDASILFPKVISDLLLRPKEPLYVGQNLLARTLNVDATRTYEFPMMGAVRAFEVGEAQEYRSQGPGFTQGMAEIKIKKYGLMLEISEDVINDSQWDILGLYVEAAGNALTRKKEEIIFDAAVNYATIMFDNGLQGTLSGGSTITALKGWTTGRDEHGIQRNGTLGLDDLIDAIAGLVANQYTPTDIVIHPLAWSVLATNPILRAHALFGGVLGNSVWQSMGPESVATNLPWNISVTVSPFAPTRLSSYAYAPNGGAESYISGSAAANWTDILVLDRGSSLLLLQRSAPESEEFRDPRRDIQAFKVKERYGVGALNGGKSVVLIKNVKIARGYELAYYVGNVTP